MAPLTTPMVRVPPTYRTWKSCS